MKIVKDLQIASQLMEGRGGGSKSLLQRRLQCRCATISGGKRNTSSAAPVEASSEINRGGDTEAGSAAVGKGTTSDVNSLPSREMHDSGDQTNSSPKVVAVETVKLSQDKIVTVKLFPFAIAMVYG